jgi:glycerophosphoryl diester phosphodiesterase
MRLLLFTPLDGLFAPAPDKARVAFLKAQPFAHRGLHGEGVIENSRAAFVAAIALGHGIELDVQAAGDGEPFVFHDEQLERLTNERGAIADCMAAELDRIRLKDSDETIPRLSEILALVAGRAPMLIEVKTPDHHCGMLCVAVRRALEGYRGDVAVMSFNPNVGRWFHAHAPRTVRGLVVTEAGPETALERIKARAERHLALWRARPDFLAYDIRDLPSRFAGAQRRRGLPLLTWTVRTAEQEQTAFAYTDEAIYEKPKREPL